MMQHHIGTKQVMAWPCGEYDFHESQGWPFDTSRPSRQGYAVRYPDGYESWCPKETFEAAYLPMGEESDGSTITQQMVDDFIGNVYSIKIGDKTTVVQVTLRNGFVITESSSCVDPANYDHELGTSIAIDRVKDKVWMLLGFLLQTARNGVDRTRPRPS